MLLVLDVERRLRIDAGVKKIAVIVVAEAQMAEPFDMSAWQLARPVRSATKVVETCRASREHRQLHKLENMTAVQSRPGRQ